MQLSAPVTICTISVYKLRYQPVDDEHLSTNSTTSNERDVCIGVNDELMTLHLLLVYCL